MKKRLFSIIAILLIAVMAVPVLADGEALIFNPDFEKYSGDEALPDGWTFHSYEEEANEELENVTVVCEQDPQRGGVVHITSLQDDDAALYQSISVESSSLYKLSCWIKTKGVENGRGANIALREVVARSEGVFGDSDWTLVELVGKTGPAQDTLIVSCRLGGYGEEAHGEAWFDDFRIEKLESTEADVVPFYRGDTSSDEADEESDNKNSSIIPIIIIIGAVIAAAVIVALAVGSKKRKAEEDKEETKADTKRTSAKNVVSDKDLLRGSSFFSAKGELPGPTDTKLRFTKLDWVFSIALTVVYAIVALLRLGTLDFPTSAWSGNAHEAVTIRFDRRVKISEVWQNSGISYCDYTLTTDNNEQIAFKQDDRSEYGHMFRWEKLDSSMINKTTATSGVTLTVNGGDTSRGSDPDLVLNELVFFDENGEKIPCTASGAAAALFDEQETVPEYASFYNGMYFDELYHGRTALEHINNMKVYEWTHPPLGKLIIAFGIMIFGMKPFGWRIMGTLFGIAMVPIMYCFGKRLLKRSHLALFSSLLFAFDFMHFTQTRIATVDVFGVFFIMLMTYFMLKFISMDIGDSTKAMLKPLALSGLFFGLGCASKWICIYTGAALALMFFAKLIVMGVKSYRLGRRSEYKSKDLVGKYWRTFGLLCSWCVIFFIVVPVVIYAASYCRYYTAQWKPDKQLSIYNKAPDQYDSVDDVKLGFGEAVETYVKGVIKNQNDMFNYHSQLKSDHSAASTWWMWLGDMRPAWFYVGGYGSPSGGVGTISAFGNPAVWILCNIAAVVWIFLLIFHRKRFPTEDFFLYAALASSLLPWVLVPRSTYAYHFFASVPFIVLLAGRLLMYWEDTADLKNKLNGIKTKPFVHKVKYIWMAVVLVLFVLFYPVISGLEVSRNYIHALEWMPFHKIEIQDTNGKVEKTYRIGWRFLDYEPKPLEPEQLTIIVKE